VRGRRLAAAGFDTTFLCERRAERFSTFFVCSSIAAPAAQAPARIASFHKGPHGKRQIPQAPPRGAQASLPNAQTLAKANLQYYWTMERKDLALQEDESISIVYKLDENLYAVTDHDRLICIDKDRGLLKWSYAIRTNGERIFRPCRLKMETSTCPLPGI